MTKHIMFCGVGGTGKSVCAAAFQDTHATQPSITREAYAAYGIKDQKEGDAMSPEKRVAFQQFIFNFYLGKVRDTVQVSDKPVVLERSPIDHLAYMSLVSVITDQQYQAALDLLLDLKPVLVYFPYPTPWGEQDDGFRNLDKEQNARLNDFMLSVLNRLAYPYHQLDTFDKRLRIYSIQRLLDHPSYGSPWRN